MILVSENVSQGVILVIPSALTSTPTLANTSWFAGIPFVQHTPQSQAAQKMEL